MPKMTKVIRIDEDVYRALQERAKFLNRIFVAPGDILRHDYIQHVAFDPTTQCPCFEE